MSAALTDPPTTPFKGLANYTEHDAALFFGRDREREIIIANVKARRLTVLYGESGVGKSSLLRAGVMSDLVDAARRNLADAGTPEHVPVMFSAWSDEPVAGLGSAVREAVRAFCAEPPQAPPAGSLVEVVDSAARFADAQLLIILDQFEEYFLYHPAEEGPATFAAELPRILTRPGVQANVLLSVREDALAKLDRFKRDVPGLFDSSLRINHLDAAAAREAIRGPVAHYNALAAPGERVVLEAALVDAVIDQVRRGRVVLEQTGQGMLERGEDVGPGADRIETPYLQLVMSRLWEVERARGSSALHAATLAELGGAQEIVRTHLDAALRSLTQEQSETAVSLFHHLVTPSGSKIAHAVPDLAEYVRRPESQVRELLEQLARPETRILRPVPPPLGEDGPARFEIFHDVLAPSVLAWRTRQAAARRIEEQRRAARAAMRRRLRRVVGIVAAVGFAGVAALAVLANAERNKAERQEARARALAEESNRQELRARALADEAKRQEERARALRARAEMEAARARRLARRNERQAKINRRQAAEARALAEVNRRQAAEARVLTARARSEAALARELAAFEPSLSYFFAMERDGVRMRNWVVTAPPSTRVRAVCVPQRCRPFGGTVPESGRRRISTIEGDTVPFGVRMVFVLWQRNIGKTYAYRTTRQHPVLRRIRAKRCRPAGSRVAPADVPLACP